MLKFSRYLVLLLALIGLITGNITFFLAGGLAIVLDIRELLKGKLNFLFRLIIYLLFSVGGSLITAGLSVYNVLLWLSWGAISGSLLEIFFMFIRYLKRVL